MNEFRTTVSKTKDRWEATSTTMIEGTNRELSISTSRGSDGVVCSRATVFRIEGGFKSHAIGFGSPRGDFSKTVLSMRHQRASEKAIRGQHQTAMAQAESILFQVRKHYAAQQRAAEAEGEAAAAATTGHAEVLA